MRKLFIYFLFLSPPLLGEDLFSLRELYMDYKYYYNGSRNYLIDQSEYENRALDQGLSLIFNVDILKHGYFDNEIIGLTDRDKVTEKSRGFRAVGWKFDLGFRLFEYFKIKYGHYSRHRLDVGHINGDKFPVDDSIGLEIWFYKQDK